MTRRRWALAAAAVVVAVMCGVVVSRTDHPTAVPRTPTGDTVAVQRGRLSATISQAGTLTYRAGTDGSPSPVIDRARGVYTELPDIGDEVACGRVLYRVDDRPVVLLCGTIPAYRDLHVGAEGRDVRQLNRSLRRLGYRAGAGARFTARTEAALRRLQRRRGLAATGTLGVAGAVFLPGAVRIAKVTGQLGGPARPGTPVLSATSTTLHVQVDLDASQRGGVRRGDRAQITLPGATSVAGRVAGFGRVARAPVGRDGPAAAATIPTYVSLDDPDEASGLDRAPVGVDITTRGVDDALSVPVTALVGRSGGGFAVEVVREGRRRELVAVELGLFDTGGGRVQVEGDLRAGDPVVVPSA